MGEENELGDLDANLIAQMLGDFLDESQEYLDQLNSGITRLETNPDDKEVINELFRAAHTIKGTASFVSLEKIRDVAHKMEDVFGDVRNGSISITAVLIDVMFEATSTLILLRDKEVAKDTQEVDVSPILDKLAAVLDAGSPTDKKKSTQIQQKPVTEVSTETSAGASEVTVDGNVGYVAPDTIRVSTDRLDNFMNMVGELITSHNRLSDFSERLKNEELKNITASIAHLTSQIHAGMMKVRMVQIEKVFVKFPSVVRKIARELNKDVELVIAGRDTELDKTVTEQIYSPLVHLLRNSIDHGLESRVKRKELGKSPTGQIKLSAWHSQNNIMIEVSDDGQGIDIEKVKKIAVQKGVITQENALAISDDEAIRLIFLPGFSCAAKVTDISGRGVGMDVVKENVQKLHGMVDVTSVVGKGTTFILQLPLTLAILKVLLVKAGELTFAIPLNAVTETILLNPADINTMEKNETIFVRGKVYPLKRLSEIMKCSSTSLEAKENIPVLIVGMAERKVALYIDELVGKQEVVMKSLGDYLGMVEGIEGAAILADGSITLIVGVEGLLRCN